MSYQTWTPALVFSAHNSEVELMEAKVKTARIISSLASIPKWVLGNAGVPIVFGETVAWLIRFVADVEESKKRLIEAKMEEAAVISAVSLYQAKIIGIQGRLDRLLRDISTRERELEIVPAFMSCQETLALFRETEYPFWKKPEISAPLLVSFAGIYVSVCRIVVELIDSYRLDVAKEMGILGNVVDDYRHRFLCFRLYQPKYPIFSRKGTIIDKYDKKFRSNIRSTTTIEFDCSCLHRQHYSLLLAQVYGSFFDSVKVAIIDSALLPGDETPKNEWCTQHKRCYFVYKMQKECICKGWNPNKELLSMKGKEVEKVITAGQCLATISSIETSVRHYQYICNTCEFVAGEPICRSCMLTCHEGHDIEFLQYGWFSCYCADNNTSNTKCKLVTTTPEITVNSDNAAVIRGRDGYGGGDTGLQAFELYYCGRRMNECRCGQCDGFCGPISGCPCNSCLELVFPELNEYAWPLVTCDECAEKIIGERYNCKDCNDYDLCKCCIADEVHICHDFVRMTKTSNGVERADVHRFVTCQLCEKQPLCGTRYKCTECEDYDLCTSCHDAELHEHSTFTEISTSKRNPRNSKESWNRLIELMKNTQLSKFESTDVIDAEEDDDPGNSGSESEKEEDFKKVCFLFEREPEIPFLRYLACRENTVSYVININGRISENPHSFEVILGLEEKILLYFNPRWDQEKIVLNTYDNEWGLEEFADSFESLVSNAEFSLEIVFEDSGFQITINDKDPVYFANRILDEQIKLLVEVKGDVILELVKFDLYNST